MASQTDSATPYSDINQILDQILNITDQSLDEAQVRKILHIFSWTEQVELQSVSECSRVF